MGASSGGEGKAARPTEPGQDSDTGIAAVARTRA